jgi:DNA transposition AAA+ family ATPase
VSDRRPEGKWSEEEQQALRERVLELLREEDVSRRQMAQESGIAYGTLTPWLGGTYAGDGSGVADRVRIWMEARARRMAVRPALPAPRYVATPTAEAILAALSHAQHMPDMVVITGAPGTGKTSAACQYTRSNPNVWKLVADPALNTVRALLGALAGLLNTYDQGGQYRIAASLRQRMAGSQGLIVVDEAQHLTSQMLDQLRAFHDQCGVGVALLGNEAVVGRLEGGRRSAEYAQLYSRVGMRLKRPRPLKADAEALLDAWGVEAAEVREPLRALARLPGGLRNLQKCHRLAGMIAQAEGGRAITADDVRVAWERLGATPAAAA